ncbi:MAG: Kelch repeat-containing protein, partial [Polyangiales bacterium]
MNRRARFLFAPLVLASGAGFFACSSSPESGKSSAGVQRSVEAQRAMTIVQRSKTFAPVVEAAKAPSRTESGWILASPSTKAAVVNSHLDATLPTHAQGAIHVGNKDHTGESLDVSAEGVEPVEGRLVDNALVFANAAPSTDIVHVLDGVEVEELRVLRDANAPTVARYSIRKGDGIVSVRVEGNRVQALDKDGHVRIQSAGVFAVDAKGVRRDLVVAVQHDGDHEVLTASLDTTGLEFPVIVDPAWATVASMKNPRQYAAAVQLSTGKIMVAGGENFADAVNVVEQYDPATDTWSDMPSMAHNRSNGQLFAFPGGRALAVGGYQGVYGSSPTPAIAPTELYNGTAWVAPTADPDPRSSPSVFDLGNGKVLYVGGVKQTYTACPSSGSPSTCVSGFCQAFSFSDPPGSPGYCSGTLKQTYVNTAEVYDATANTWAAAGTLAGLPAPYGSSGGPFGTSYDFAAVTLFQKIAGGPNAGKYLVVYNSTKATTATPSTTSDYAPEKVIAQIFDPATNTWSAALPDLPASATVKARGQYGFTKLPSGLYMFVAGLGLTGTSPSFTTAQLATSFTLDLSTATAAWGTTGVLRCGRDRFATVVDAGKVRVTMGNIKPFIDPVKGSQYCNEEEYNPATDT